MSQDEKLVAIDNFLKMENNWIWPYRLIVLGNFGLTLAIMNTVDFDLDRGVVRRCLTALIIFNIIYLFHSVNLLYYMVSYTKDVGLCIGQSIDFELKNNTITVPKKDSSTPDVVPNLALNPYLLLFGQLSHFLINIVIGSILVTKYTPADKEKDTGYRLIIGTLIVNSIAFLFWIFYAVKAGVFVMNYM